MNPIFGKLLGGGEGLTWNLMPQAIEAEFPQGRFFALYSDDRVQSYRGYMVHYEEPVSVDKELKTFMAADIASHVIAVSGPSVSTLAPTPPPSPRKLPGTVSFCENVIETIYGWLRVIPTWPARERELVEAAAHLVTLLRQENVSDAVLHINSYQRLLGLPIVVRDHKGALAPPDSSKALARDQVVQALGSADISQDANDPSLWVPRSLKFHLQGLDALQRRRWCVRAHLWQGHTRLSETFEGSWEAHESPESINCVFSHILVVSEPVKVSLVIELGEAREYGFQHVAVGLANVSNVLRPLWTSSHDFEVSVPIYALKSDDRKGWGTLYRRMISGGATGLVWPQDIRRLFLKVSAYPESRNYIGGTHISSLVRDYLNLSPNVWLDLGMLILRSVPKGPGDMWVRVNGISAYASSGQDIGLGTRVSAAKHFEIELFRGDRLVARGRGIPSLSSEIVRVTMIATGKTTAPFALGHLSIWCTSATLGQVEKKTDTFLSENLYEVLNEIQSLDFDKDESTAINFHYFVEKLLALIGKEESDIISGAFNTLVRLLSWSQRPQNSYLFDNLPSRGVIVDGSIGLRAELTRNINCSKHQRLIDVFKVSNRLGWLLQPISPSVESADALLPLTQALMTLFSAPQTPSTIAAKVTCLKGLDLLYFPKTTLSAPSEVLIRLAMQIGSVLDCVHNPTGIMAASFYTLLGRLARTKVFLGPLRNQFAAHVYQWTENFWKDPSLPSVREQRAVARLLMALPESDWYVGKLVEFVQSLTKGIKPETPRALFLEEPPTDGVFEAMIEFLVVLSTATDSNSVWQNEEFRQNIEMKSLVDTASLIAVAKLAAKPLVPRQWVSLDALLLRTALQLLRIAINLLQDRCGLDTSDGIQTNTWRELLITSCILAGDARLTRDSVLARYSVYIIAGDVRHDALSVLSEAWEWMGSHQNRLDGSDPFYTELLALGLRCSDDTEVTYNVSRIIVSTLDAQYILEESMVIFAQLLFRALDKACEKYALGNSTNGFSRIFDSLRAITMDSEPKEQYRNFIETFENVTEARLTLAKFPNSLLATDMLLQVLKQYEFVDEYRDLLLKIGEWNHEADRILGFVYLALERSYSWEDHFHVLQECITPPMPPQSPAQRRKALLDIAVQYLVRGGCPELAVDAMEEEMRWLSRKADFSNLSRIAPRLGVLYATLAATHPTTSNNYYLLTFPSSRFKFGALSNRTFVYDGGSKRLEEALETFEAEFDAKCSLRGDDSTIAVRTLSRVDMTLETQPLYTGAIFASAEFSAESVSSSLAVQRTVYRISRPLPTLSNYSEVTYQKTEILDPVEVARNALQAKADELRRAMAHSDRMNHLELVLQGAVHAPVNGGVKTFMSMLSDTDLRAAFYNLKETVSQCLEVYGTIVSENMRPHYEMLCREFVANYTINE